MAKGKNAKKVVKKKAEKTARLSIPAKIRITTPQARRDLSVDEESDSDEIVEVTENYIILNVEGVWNLNPEFHPLQN